MCKNVFTMQEQIYYVQFIDSNEYYWQLIPIN